VSLAETTTIPTDLRERPQWVVWRRVDRGGRMTKVPFRCDGAGKASTTDPSTWSTFEAAVAATEALAADGVGYVFAADDPFVGLDLDEGLSAADRGAIVLMLDSAETTVGGQGVHVFVRASLDGRGRNRRGPFEVYESGRYFTVTGQHLRGTPTTIEERQRQLERVLDQFLPEPEPGGPLERQPEPVDLDDRELLNRALAARDSGDFQALYAGRWEGRFPSQSEADLEFCGMLAFWTGRDAARIDRLFRSSGLVRPKWERRDYREATIAKAVGGCAETYSPSRPAVDANGTQRASAPSEKEKTAIASPRPALELLSQ